ncbi:hypothetical protein M9H77_15113 [Catharanthus roseus]|uniref:Uncharacterized protein n=1 Tax=Catharanthus roseus TaxID=4058 RepID=A0ACC0BPY8_CATRO|nr:hypothetical protein M9H77_15113 [Catharanthus roseus]
MVSSNYVVLLLYLLVFSSWVHVQSEEEEGYISATVFNKGLDFLVKELLIDKAKTSMLPIEFPNIEKHVKIPVIGNVYMEASNMTLYSLDITSSTAKIGDTGIVISATAATANLSLNWKYSYSSWLFPVPIGDKGEASVQVQGLDIGLTIGLKNEQGSLKLSVLESGCYVKDISIVLKGGASWLYQGFVDAFEGLITSKLENTIPEKIAKKIESFNSVLESFPKEVPITSLAALNITFVGDPELSDTSLKLALNGSFSAKDDIPVSKYEYLQDPSSCNSPPRMVKISVNDHVFESLLMVYFEADKMHWIVDKVPDKSLLNTAGWKYIVPQLYKQYPDDDMNLNISVYSPPLIRFEKAQVAVTVPLDVIINVLDGGETIPVACVSVVISAAASPEISQNTLAGTVKLNKFSMSLQWSKIGNLHVNLVQSLISTLLRTIVLPFVNLKLSRGVPLPNLYGYGLENTKIEYANSWFAVCSDLVPIKKLQTLFVPGLHHAQTFEM